MKNALKVTVMAVLFFIAFYVVQVIVAMIFSSIIIVQYIAQNVGNIDFASLTEQTIKSIIQWSTAIALTSDIVVLIVLFIIYLVKKEKAKEELSLRKIRFKDLLPPVLLGITISAAETVLLLLLPIPGGLMDKYEKAAEALYSGSVVLQILSIVIVAPVVEELIFRGLILSRLRKGMSPAAAAIVSSLIFGVAHGTPVWMACAFLAGLALSFLCIRYRSVLAPIAMHITFNLISVVTDNVFTGIQFNGIACIVVLVFSLAICGFIIFYILRKTPELEINESAPVDQLPEPEQ